MEELDGGNSSVNNFMYLKSERNQKGKINLKLETVSKQQKHSPQMSQRTLYMTLLKAS